MPAPQYDRKGDNKRNFLWSILLIYLCLFVFSYSEELTGLIGTLMTVNPMERCDIESVIQAVENIINKLENRI